jgi:hypothetical protein
MWEPALDPWALLAQGQGRYLLLTLTWMRHLLACSSVPVPNASFAGVGQAMRTIDATSVAPRAWAWCNASSADAAWKVCSARKVTVNCRGSPERLASAGRARRLWVGAGLKFAARVRIGAATVVRGATSAVLLRLPVPGVASPAIGATAGSGV